MARRVVEAGRDSFGGILMYSLESGAFRASLRPFGRLTAA